MRALRGWFALAVAALLVSGCGPAYKRNPVPEEFKYEAHVPGLEFMRIIGPERAMVGWSERRQQFIEDIANSDAYDGPLVFLSISGGGANGAFTAGLLAGWTIAGDRPEFHYVTGISTGALIAPFAFLGSAYDAKLEELYTTMRTKDIVKQRGLLAAISSDAFATTKGLRRKIGESIDDAMIAAIAREHQRGRRLHIATTNLDLMTPVYWNIGAIAASGDPKAPKLIRDLLLASASIPGVFPPVYIEVTADGQLYDEMHVDGGAAAQVFAYPGIFDMQEELEGVGLTTEGARLFVIRNSNLSPHFQQVEPKLFSIISRSIASMIRTQGIGDLYQIYLLTQRDGIEFNLAYIGSEFDSVASEPFDPVYMTELFKYGRLLARTGYNWQKEPPAYDED